MAVRSSKFSLSYSAPPTVKNLLCCLDPNDSLEHQSVSVKLTQLLEDYDLLRNPVFVHVFSNGGFFVYQHLADVFSVSYIILKKISSFKTNL